MFVYLLIESNVIGFMWVVVDDNLEIISENTEPIELVVEQLVIKLIMYDGVNIGDL